MKLKLKSILNEISIKKIEKIFVNTGKVSKSDFDKILYVTDEKNAYVEWLTSKVAKGIIKPSDIEKFNGLFKIFSVHTSEFKSNDIQRYKTVSDVKDFLTTAEKISKEIEQDVSKQKGLNKKDKYDELFYKSTSKYNVFVIPKGRNDLYNAACDIGSGAGMIGNGRGWCISTGKTDSHFKRHIKNAPIIIFISKDGNKNDKYSRIGVALPDDGIIDISDNTNKKINYSDVSKIDSDIWNVIRDVYDDGKKLPKFNGYETFSVGDGLYAFPESNSNNNNRLYIKLNNNITIRDTIINLDNLDINKDSNWPIMMLNDGLDSDMAKIFFEVVKTKKYVDIVNNDTHITVSEFNNIYFLDKDDIKKSFYITKTNNFYEPTISFIENDRNVDDIILNGIKPYIIKGNVSADDFEKKINTFNKERSNYEYLILSVAERIPVVVDGDVNFGNKSIGVKCELTINGNLNTSLTIDDFDTNDGVNFAEGDFYKSMIIKNVSGFISTNEFGVYGENFEIPNNIPSDKLIFNSSVLPFSSTSKLKVKSIEVKDSEIKFSEYRGQFVNIDGIILESTDVLIYNEENNQYDKIEDVNDVENVISNYFDIDKSNIVIR